ncbi:MAG: DUF5666 domain-containing protein, partial [Acidimicrobiia bacterium]
SELRPGTSVEVKGQPVSAGRFLPTKVTIGIPGSDKLLGLVESVEVPTGVVTVLGCPFHVDAGTELVGLDKAPFSLADLSVGDRVNVTLDPPGGGRRRARSVMWRKPGGESKLEGPLEAVEAAGDGSVTVRVMGWAVRVDPAQVRLVHRDDTPRRWRREDVLAMVRSGNYVARDRELYRFTVDPAEVENLVDDEPVVVEELEQCLAEWAVTIADGQAPGELVELDPETMDQLRKLGYLA